MSTAVKLPVKVHRRVCLVITVDAVLAEELMADRQLSEDVAGRLSPTTLLVRPGRASAVVEQLRKIGHTPRVVGRTS